MTKRIDRLQEYIPAHKAAEILSVKLGRTIRPGYIHKLKHIRSHALGRTSKLYHRADIEAVTIREMRR